MDIKSSIYVGLYGILINPGKIGFSPFLAGIINLQ